MQRARVIGHAVATVKHATLAGYRLALVLPLGPADQADGDPLLVIDTLGGATGSTVLITSDGKSARQLIGEQTPVRYTTVGLIDESFDRRE